MTALDTWEVVRSQFDVFVCVRSADNQFDRASYDEAGGRVSDSRFDSRSALSADRLAAWDAEAPSRAVALLAPYRDEMERVAGRDARVATHTSPTPEPMARDEYERRCRAAGVTPLTDADILRFQRYGLEWAQYYPENDPDGDLAIGQVLGRCRLRALVADGYAAVPTIRATMDAAGFAPAGTTEGDPGRTGRCAQCDQTGWWNPGAGRILCERHWDEY